MNKVDFVAIMVVDGANPNGDPLGGNIPRAGYDGRGEISDVCLKHKIRKRFDAMAAKPSDAVLLVGADYGDKRSVTIRDRLDEKVKLHQPSQKKGKEELRPAEDIASDACAAFRDVRCFGLLLALKDKEKKSESNDSDTEKEQKKGISVGITGPVTIQTSKSVENIDVAQIQIVKCISADGNLSDTMGMKYRVDKSAYIIKGSINARLAEKTHMTDEDVEALKEAIKTMCWDDESAARPAGSMEVKALYWMTHNSKLGSKSSASVQRAVEVVPQKEYPYFKASVNKEKLGDSVTVEEWWAD